MNPALRIRGDLNKVLQAGKMHGNAFYKQVLIVYKNSVKIVFGDRLCSVGKVGAGRKVKPVCVVGVIRMLFYPVCKKKY